MVLDRNGWEVNSEEEFQGWGEKGIPKMEVISKNNGGISGLDLHTQNFVEAVKSRNASQLAAPIKVGYDAALVSHMGNVAFKTGNRIYWDEKAGKFKEEGANAFLKANYHNGWKLPTL